jgi:predicted DNA-binding protein
MTKKKSPPITPSSKLIPFTVLLTEHHLAKLVEMAKGEGRPKAQMARRLIEKGLDDKVD